VSLITDPPFISSSVLVHASLLAMLGMDYSRKRTGSSLETQSACRSRLVFLTKT
jgi:hypothetical protein